MLYHNISGVYNKLQKSYGNMIQINDESKGFCTKQAAECFSKSRTSPIKTAPKYRLTLAEITPIPRKIIPQISKKPSLPVTLPK